ncbi:MAG: hypothetical protein ACOZF2_09465 [Thermodesulfobacteriota bacterium]
MEDFSKELQLAKEDFNNQEQKYANIAEEIEDRTRNETWGNEESSIWSAQKASALSSFRAASRITALALLQGDLSLAFEYAQIGNKWGELYNVRGPFPQISPYISKATWDIIREGQLPLPPKYLKDWQTYSKSYSIHNILSWDSNRAFLYLLGLHPDGQAAVLKELMSAESLDSLADWVNLTCEVYCPEWWDCIDQALEKHATIQTLKPKSPIMVGVGWSMIGLSLLVFAAFLYFASGLRLSFLPFYDVIAWLGRLGPWGLPVFIAWLGVCIVLMFAGYWSLWSFYEIEKENRRRLTTQETIVHCRNLVGAARSCDASKWVDKYTNGLSLESWERIRATSRIKRIGF